MAFVKNKVAILVNKDHSKLRVVTKRLIHDLYPGRGQLGRGIVLPEFDSFAGLLDPNPLCFGTGEPIPWDSLSRCELLIWEWGWT